jgi:hypothetical protein
VRPCGDNQRMLRMLDGKAESGLMLDSEL